MKDVVRKNVEVGMKTVFEMKLQRSQFLVKNFTDGNLTVQLGENDETSLIGAKSWEKVFNNTVDGNILADATKNVTVTAEKTGIVEIASID